MAGKDAETPNVVQLSETNLSDTSKAAKYLQTDYFNYYWTREIDEQ